MKITGCCGIFGMLVALLGSVQLFAVTPAPVVNPAVVLPTRYGAAVVTVSLVVTIKASAAGKVLPPREIKQEATGTVITPSGLVVLSLAALDPGEALDGMRVNTSKGPMKLEVSSTTYDQVKIHHVDGTERDARVVLKDQDLDLVFVAPLPVAGEKAAVFVDLTLDASAQLLDTGYLLSRSSKAFNRAIVLQRSEIISIIEKPARRLVIQFSGLGCPYFDAQGRVHGICVRRISNGRPVGAIVLPAAEVAEIAMQAAAIKPEAIPGGEPAPVTEPAPETPVAPAAS